MEQNEAPLEQQEEIENDQTIEEGESAVGKEEDSSPMETLLSEGELKLDFPTQGEVRLGNIAEIRASEILVSIGTKSEGVISGREFDQISDEEKTVFEIGQEIPVYVVAPEDPSGNVVLSYTRAREEQDWESVEQLLETGGTFESEVIGYNKGGLIVPIGRLRGFVPASQVSLLRRLSFTGETPEERWGTLVGEQMEVSVIEMDRTRRRLILSERVALQETRDTLKDRLLEELEEGAVHTGRVTSLADFGAFVNIEGADGLVHLSEISWERIKHPNEVLEVGQEVDVKVISVDRDRKRIGLSIRQLQEDPWVQKVAHLRDGLLVEGTITHLTKFGAFARIDDELEGLVHVSELSDHRIEHPKEVVSEGDVVTLRIIKVDTDRRRIGLSLRKVDSPAYADLDWKMALADEVDRAQEEVPEAEIELEEVTEEVEADEVEEIAETVEEELEVEADIEEEAEEIETAAEEVESNIEEPEEDLVEAEVELEEISEEAEADEVEEIEEIAETVEEELEVKANIEEEAEEIEEEAEEELVEAEVEVEEVTEKVDEADN
ncbi:MAG: S1 RNA-binding domain-containing protein [Anaerolineales bacterium]